MMDRFDSSLSIFNFFEEKKEKKFVSITAMWMRELKKFYLIDKKRLFSGHKYWIKRIFECLNAWVFKCLNVSYSKTN